MRAYRYAKVRDAIDPLPRPENEIKQRYARLIACVTLRTLHEIFSATSGEVAEAVVFNGRVSTIDKAAGIQTPLPATSVAKEQVSGEAGEAHLLVVVSCAAAPP